MYSMLIFFLIGTAMGAIPAVFAIKVGAVSIKKKPVGDLRVVRTDEDSPYLFLELYGDVGSVTQEETVLLRVVKQKLPHD